MQTGDTDTDTDTDITDIITFYIQAIDLCVNMLTTPDIHPCIDLDSAYKGLTKVLSDIPKVSRKPYIALVYHHLGQNPNITFDYNSDSDSDDLPPQSLPETFNHYQTIQQQQKLPLVRILCGFTIIGVCVFALHTLRNAYQNVFIFTLCRSAHHTGIFI